MYGYRYQNDNNCKQNNVYHTFVISFTKLKYSLTYTNPIFSLLTVLFVSAMLFLSWGQ